MADKELPDRNRRKMVLTVGAGIFGLTGISGVHATSEKESNNEEIKSKWRKWEKNHGEFKKYLDISDKSTGNKHKIKYKCEFDDGSKKQIQIKASKDWSEKKHNGEKIKEITIKMGDERYNVEQSKSEVEQKEKELKDKNPLQNGGGE